MCTKNNFKKKHKTIFYLKRYINFASAFERRAYFTYILFQFYFKIELNQEEWQSWFNALVLKTSVLERVPGVRIPLPPLFSL